MYTPTGYLILAAFTSLIIVIVFLTVKFILRLNKSLKIIIENNEKQEKLFVGNKLREPKS